MLKNIAKKLSLNWLFQSTVEVPKHVIETELEPKRQKKEGGLGLIEPNFEYPWSQPHHHITVTS